MANLSQEVGLIIAATFFLLLVAVGIVVLVLVYRRRQVEYIHEQNRLKTAFEKELLEAQLQIQEQTMKQIAQEIHDNIGGTLTLVKLNLSTLNPAKQEAATGKISDSKALVTRAIADLRTISKTLHADAVLTMGIEQAIKAQLQMIEKSGVFTTVFQVQGTPAAIDPKKELILFRTVQEGISNAVKHAGGGLLQIHITYNPVAMQLIIQDDGHGFNPQQIAADPARGSGLRNMQNRITLIGGQFTIDGTNGTRIQITLPIIAA